MARALVQGSIGGNANRLRDPKRSSKMRKPQLNDTHLFLDSATRSRRSARGCGRHAGHPG